MENFKLSQTGWKDHLAFRIPNDAKGIIVKYKHKGCVEGKIYLCSRIVFMDNSYEEIEIINGKEVMFPDKPSKNLFEIWCCYNQTNNSKSDSGWYIGFSFEFTSNT